MIRITANNVTANMIKMNYRNRRYRRFTAIIIATVIKTATVYCAGNAGMNVSAKRTANKINDYRMACKRHTESNRNMITELVIRRVDKIFQLFDIAEAYDFVKVN